MDSLKFKSVPKKSSKILLATIGKNAKLKPFVKALQDLNADEIGYVQATQDASPVSIRRMLTSAATLLDMEIQIERDDATIYYWIEDTEPAPNDDRDTRQQPPD